MGLFLHCTDETAVALRGEVTCPRSHSNLETELKREPRLFDSPIYVFLLVHIVPRIAENNSQNKNEFSRQNLEHFGGGDRNLQK